MRRLATVLAKINAPGYRAGRVAALTEFVGRWREGVLSHKRLDELGAETIQAFVSALSHRCTRETVLNIVSTLSAILNTAKQWGYI